MTVILGYARVSTINQSTENQRQLLLGSGCDEVFIDESVSGTKNRNAAGYRSMLARVQDLRDSAREVTVRVKSLDRFSRTTLDMLEGVDELAALGASFQSMSEGFTYDVNSPFSKLMLTNFAAMAEFERGLIERRLKDGLDVAVSKGLIFGPRPKVNDATAAAIRADYSTGAYTTYSLATKWGLSRTLVGRILGLYGSRPFVTQEQWDASRQTKEKRS